MFSFSSWFTGGSAAIKNQPDQSLVSVSTPTPAPTAAVPAPAPKLGSVQPSTAETHIQSTPERTPVFSKRSLSQLSLFAAGAGFLAASIFITRRAVRRHQISAQLKFYQPNHGKGKVSSEKQEGRNPMVAVEALNLATLNVMSFAVMAVGGISWAFDLSSLDDLRSKAQRTLRGPGGFTDEAAEQEVADWVANVLSLKEDKKIQESGDAADKRPKNGD